MQTVPLPLPITINKKLKNVGDYVMRLIKFYRHMHFIQEFPP